ncbi:MAG: phosphate ABC transporter ATP-binding protein [Pyramidobacter sp.]|jgi:phosphate transport system ATP-binding protein
MNLCAAVRNLSVSAGDHAILKDVSLDCPDKAITVLVGRSGSGKTTLLRSINRLNEHFPALRTCGKIALKVDGRLEDVFQLPLTELRRRAGMVFQSPNPLPLSVERNMLLPLKLTMGVAGSEARDRAEKALREVGLMDEISGRLTMDALALSGGQQQRLCLARTLALEPDVLLLDEPTASLDHHAAEIVEDLMLSLKERYPIVMVSHSLRQARRTASRLAVLRDGRLAGTFRASDIPEGVDGEEFIKNLL